MRIRSIPFWISTFIHLVVIGAGTALFYKQAVFAVDAGRNSMEVSLVAAAPDPVEATPTPVDPQETVDPNPPKPDDMVVPAATPVPPSPVPPVEQPKVQPPPTPVPPKPHRTPTIAKGDGSAPKPGKDATTASSVGGAITNVKPDYLSNPPPIYPDDEERAGHAGVVTLQVIINTEGRPDQIVIQTSTGFPALDQAAVTAVRKWRFKPAELGPIKVKSQALVPVRFKPPDD